MHGYVGRFITSFDTEIHRAMIVHHYATHIQRACVKSCLIHLAAVHIIWTIDLITDTFKFQSLSLELLNQVHFNYSNDFAFSFVDQMAEIEWQ